jgi:D-serine deaminase-like pyridoxal phosphate-dependent protein
MATDLERDTRAWNDLAQVVPLPGAFVDVSALDENIGWIDDCVKSPRTIRVATKSIRVPEILNRIALRSRKVKGWMTFSAKETEFLAQQGFDDFLLAYPVFHKTDIQAILNVLHLRKTLYLVVDSQEGLDRINTALESQTPESYQTLKIIVEFDCHYSLGFLSLGVKRSPLKKVEDVIEFIQLIRTRYPRLKFGGIMAYEAVSAGVGDKSLEYPLRNAALKGIRKLALQKFQSQREQLHLWLAKNQISYSVFNGGGTGDVNWVGEEKSLTEVTVGSGYLCGHLFSTYSNLKLKPAIFIGTQVVRVPGPDTVTVLGGGFVASGVPGWDRLPRPVFDHQFLYDKNEGAGEVQTPFRFHGELSKPPKHGDIIFLRPAKSGEIAERFSEYQLVQNGKAVARAPTYRGMGQCFF